MHLGLSLFKVIEAYARIGPADESMIVVDGDRRDIGGIDPPYAPPPLCRMGCIVHWRRVVFKRLLDLLDKKNGGDGIVSRIPDLKNPLIKTVLLEMQDIGTIGIAPDDPYMIGKIQGRIMQT
jgi:hypothetical protein